MLFAPTIGTALAARYWYVLVRCPACRTTQSIDLRRLHRHRKVAVSKPLASQTISYDSSKTRDLMT